VTTGGARADPYMPALAPDFFERAADTIAASIPRAERATFEGQGHVADPTVVAPRLAWFFGA
jgi:hypothetical protein